MLSTAAGVKLVFLVLLGPVAALYDLATNPNAPPQIFVAQWNNSFPNRPIEPRPTPKAHKKVYVTRSS